MESLRNLHKWNPYDPIYLYQILKDWLFFLLTCFPVGFVAGLNIFPHSSSVQLAFSTRLCKNLRFRTRYGMTQTELNFFRWRLSKLFLFDPDLFLSSLFVSTSIGVVEALGWPSSDSTNRKISTIAPAAASSQAPDSLKLRKKIKFGHNPLHGLWN